MHSRKDPKLLFSKQMLKSRLISIFPNRETNKHYLPPFSLIRDFGKQNTRGNVSKISVSLACY